MKLGNEQLGRADEQALPLPPDWADDKLITKRMQVEHLICSKSGQTSLGTRGLDLSLISRGLQVFELSLEGPQILN